MFGPFQNVRDSMNFLKGQLRALKYNDRIHDSSNKRAALEIEFSSATKDLRPVF